MKKNLLYLIFLLVSCFTAYSQEIMNDPGVGTNETIQQIRILGMNDILGFQIINQGVNNYAYTQQTGDQNLATVSQQKEVGSESSNQSFITQSGNSNELTIGQVGSGNTMLGFQLGYLSTRLGSQQELPLGIENGNVFTSASLIEQNSSAVGGERNNMSITQNGNHNGVMAVQHGTDNIISAEQTGNNNYLLALQTGTHNSVTDYKQANESEQILFDRIIQVGDNLSLKADGASTYKPTANSFIQAGSNLSLEVNNDLLNTVGGVKINQTGTDMKVVVDQSYFAFPIN